MSVRTQGKLWGLAVACWLGGTAAACDRQVLLGHLSSPAGPESPVDAGGVPNPGDHQLHFRNDAILAIAPDPRAIQSADLDRDGQIDLIVAHGQAQLVRSFLGSGDGSFPRFYDTPCSDAVTGLVVADLNADRRPDLAVILATQGLVQVFAGLGDGSFTAARTYATGSGPLLAADFNGDGRPDLAVATASEVVVLLSGPLGVGFEAVTPSHYPIQGAASALAARDLNRDLFPDLVIAMGGMAALQVLINDGHGTFSISSTELGEPSSTIALVDLDASGLPKGVVTGASTLSLLYNQGGRLYQDSKFSVRYPVGRNPNWIVSADLDRDGHLDLLTGSADEPTLSVLYGSGTGDIGRLGTPLPIAAPAIALTIGDWNQDALPDLALVTATPAQLHVLIGLSQR